MIDRVNNLLKRMSMTCLGVTFVPKVSYDKIFNTGRVYVQLSYIAPCSKENKVDIYRSRKWYLSEYMTDDEIVKTCYAAFEMAIKHEILEGFQVDGVSLFNPHVDFEELIKISHKEVVRS